MPPPTSAYSAAEAKEKKCPTCDISSHQESECWYKYPDKALGGNRKPTTEETSERKSSPINARTCPQRMTPLRRRTVKTTSEGGAKIRRNVTRRKWINGRCPEH